MATAPSDVMATFFPPPTIVRNFEEHNEAADGRESRAIQGRLKISAGCSACTLT
jgi:hypothetical protein